MSYFGNDGPAQDGGFLYGIGAGQQRLAAAQKVRSRHASKYGLGSHPFHNPRRWWQQVVEEGGGPRQVPIDLVEATVNLLEQDMPDASKLARLTKDYEVTKKDYQMELANWKKNSEDASETERKVMEGDLVVTKQYYDNAIRALNEAVTSGPYMREYKVWGISAGLVLLGAGAFVWAITRKRKIQRAPGRKSAMYAVFG